MAWGFGAVWQYATTGAILTQYAKLLDTPQFAFGILAAVPYLAALAQIPASIWMERHGKRKRLFLAAATAHRLLWLAIAALPWILPRARWLGLVGVFGLSSILGNVATPAWVAWMADLVPARIRGRFFSRRIQLGQIVGLPITILVGLLLDWAQGGSRELLQACISGLLAAAALSGTVDILLFSPVPDPRGHEATPGLGLRAYFAEPLSNRPFLRLLAYNATLTFGVGYISQFVWLYILDVGGFGNAHANFLLVALPALFSIMVYPAWGRLLDRVGCRPILLIGGLLIVNGASAWILVTRENWWISYVAVLAATLAWPGVELARFNFLLRLSASQSSAYVALNNAVMAVAGTASGFFGGFVAAWLGDWQSTIGGWPLTFHGVLFLISAAVRFASLGWILGLPDPRALPVRVALRYMASGLYSNLQQAAGAPYRFLGWLQGDADGEEPAD